MLNVTSIIRNHDNNEYVLFWNHEEPTPGYITEACLSQWYPCRIQADGRVYNCAEQFMAAEKARLMGDSEVEAQIMTATDPAAIRQLGQMVRGFDDDEWDVHKLDVAVRANMLKFTQNPDLQQFLLATGDAVLVEASPYDTMWGIGIPASSPEALDPQCWRGQNLLGFTLMEVRERLRRQLGSSQPRRLCGITPNYITALGPDEIFVFGSNRYGEHHGGAARIAYERFGAEMGVGEGLQGRSYAIPTMGGGVDTIRPHVDRFIRFARDNEDMHFMVTRIGCGIAGFDDSEIAPLFREAVGLPNVSLPRTFLAILGF